MSEQKDEMTAAERLKAYNAGEEVDYNSLYLVGAGSGYGGYFLDLRRHSLRKILK